jgi:hypothetical protein
LRLFVRDLVWNSVAAVERRHCEVACQ